MPSDVSIRRFKGLITDTPNAEGEIDELIRCENAQFDKFGQLESRPGFKFYANPREEEDTLYFLGMNTDKERILASSNDFQLTAYYKWPSGDIPSPSLERIGILPVSAGSRTSNVVTLNITVSQHHGLNVGDTIIVNVSDSSYNGRFNVASVLTGPHRITYSQTAADDVGSGIGEVITVPRNLDVGINFNSKTYFSDGRFYDPLFEEFGRVAGLAASQAASMVYHADRMWFIDRSSSGSRLRFSNPADPTSWPAANFIDINPGDGSTVADLRSFQNRLYIFKTENIWVLDTPSTPTTWFLRKFTEIGSIDRQSTEYDGVMYWIASTGAYKFDGSEVTKISDPIQHVFDEAVSTPFDVVVDPFPYPPVFRDQWIISLYIGGQPRILCYNVKLNLWSEWTFPYYLETNNFTSDISLNFIDAPISVWAEIGGHEFIDTIPNLFMTIRDTKTFRHANIVGTESNPNSTKWIDESGSRIGISKIIEHPFEIIIQTKYSYFGDPYNKKRSLEWMLENEGGDVLINQIDERQVSVNKTVNGSNTPGNLHLNKVKGIGYFRRLSLKFTVSNFKSVGFKFSGIYGRMITKGRQKDNREQVIS